MSAPQHSRYNTFNYPVLVCHHGNWDIFRNEHGECAAIPTSEGEKAGCEASHFGNLAYVRQTLAREVLTFEEEQAIAFALCLTTPIDETADVVTASDAGRDFVV